jgi:hypothetical protein
VAEIIVERRGHIPVRLLRRVYFVLPLDDQGRVDIERLRKQQRALAASVIDAALAARQDPAELHQRQHAGLIDRDACGVAAEQLYRMRAALSMLALFVRVHYSIRAFAQTLGTQS